jgi:hypothetical protein
MADVWSDLIGTIKSVFRVGFSKAVIDAGALSAERVYDLPDKAGTFALLDDIPTPVKRETPSGATNGVNVTYVLAHTPIAGTEDVILNGDILDEGAGNDYTIAGDTITTATPLVDGDKIRVSYFY